MYSVIFLILSRNFVWTRLLLKIYLLKLYLVCLIIYYRSVGVLDLTESQNILIYSNWLITKSTFLMSVFWDWKFYRNCENNLMAGGWRDVSLLGRIWLVSDCCGLVCAAMTWSLGKNNFLPFEIRNFQRRNMSLTSSFFEWHFFLRLLHYRIRQTIAQSTRLDE